MIAIRPLRESSDAPIRARLCIVGAGVAGIYLACRLAALGQDVLVVEAGGAKAERACDSEFTAPLQDTQYPAWGIGRGIGLGGTGNYWGGQLLPYAESDFAGGDPGWSVVRSTIQAGLANVLQTLGLPSKSFSKSPQRFGVLPPALTDVAHFSLWLSFRKRNLVGLLSRPVRGRIDLWLEATACQWQLRTECQTPMVESLSVSDRGGRRREIHADRFVLAAGALETTRIVLELGQLCRSEAFSKDVGRYLGDHLSLPIAEVSADHRSTAAQILAPAFDGPWMRTVRFLTRDLLGDGPRGFVHPLFTASSLGFEALRSRLLALQQRRLLKALEPPPLAAWADIARIAYHRLVRGRLNIGMDAPCLLQLDLEQHRSAQSHLTLGSDRDQFGRPILNIDYRISDEDLSNFDRVGQRFRRWWTGQPGLPALQPINTTLSVDKPHSTYHPVGTLRVGDDPDAVVAGNLNLRGMANIDILSTALLPSAGSANPTLTLLCFAETLAQRLHRLAESP